MASTIRQRRVGRSGETVKSVGGVLFFMRHYASEFYVNGYQCTIEIVHRDHYAGYVEDEQIESSHSTNHIRNQLIDDAKWRESIEPDYWKIVRATHNYIKQFDGWVYGDSIRNAIQPEESPATDVQSAFFDLESFDLIERGELHMGSGTKKMWRPLDGKVDFEEAGLKAPFSHYESK